MTLFIYAQRRQSDSGRTAKKSREAKMCTQCPRST